jgi:hypothetical protein
MLSNRIAAALAIVIVVTSIGGSDAFAESSAKDKGSATAGGGVGESPGSGAGGGVLEPSIEGAFDQYPGGAKRWQLSLGFEYHHLIQSDFAPGVAVNGPPDAGNGLNHDVIVYDVSGYWEPTPRDRIWAEWTFVQRFIKDMGEDVCPSTGPGDGIIAYRRTIRLPRRFILRVQPRVDVGLSCESALYESLIAAPRLGVSGEREFGPVNVSLEVHGYWYFVRYTSYTGPENDPNVGGAPTPETSLHAVLRVYATMPFHRRLSVGLLATAATTWYHQVGGSNPVQQQLGSVSDPLVPDQAFQNTYGGEIFVRYALAPVRGVGTDVVVAYAEGDPSVTGYQNLLHDNGLASLNLFYRNVSEIYAALTFRY